jgi:hypothetical protein
LGLGHIEIIAGDDPNAALAFEEVLQMPSEQVDSALFDECHREVGLFGSVDQGFEMGQQWIELTACEMVSRMLGGWCFANNEFGWFFGKVIRELWDHVPDSTAGVGDIAAVAGDQVDVEVWDSLAGGSADVDPDVVAVGLVL